MITTISLVSRKFKFFLGNILLSNVPKQVKQGLRFQILATQLINCGTQLASVLISSLVETSSLWKVVG